MTLRGFRKGFIWGSALAFVAITYFSWYGAHRAGLSYPVDAFNWLSRIILALLFGLVCGGMAVVMRRFGRPRD